MKHLNLILPLLLMVATPKRSAATHVLGAEIRYVHVVGYTYTIETHLYSSIDTPADRPEIVLVYNNSVIDTVPRLEIVDIVVPDVCWGGIRLSKYVIEHTFPGPGTYTIDFEDQNRDGGIFNIPNSIAQAICVRTVLLIDDALGPNSSIHYQAPMVNLQIAGSQLIHDPSAFELDGDSISFEFETPNGLGCSDIAGYQFPSQMSIDPGSGIWSWQLPQLQGPVCISIHGTEWRNNTIIGEVSRDMVVCMLPSLVGIDAAEWHLGLMIHPNSTADLVSITNSTSRAVIIEVVSSTGVVVMSELFGVGIGTLDMSALASGIYQLRSKDNSALQRSARVLKY